MSAHNSGSESEDDFNPAPEIDEEEINGQSPPVARRVADDDNNEEEDTAPAKRGGNSDEEDEDEEEEHDQGGGDDDDEEDEDEEEEEEDEVVGPPKKRRKRDRRLAFLDVEAEVDDEDEEDLEDLDDEVPDEIHPDDLVEQRETDLDDRQHRELDRQRDMNAQIDAEQLAKEMDEKYRRREMARAQKSGSGAVPLALPTVDDPSIWGLKVRPGKEREIIMAITKRIEERAFSRDPLRIFSAFERGGTMSGYIYIEAGAKQHMTDAIADIPNIFFSNPPIPIEVKERPDLLRKRKRDPLENGMFVRIRRPVMYANDLGKIIDVGGNGLDVEVALVPRIDYGLNEDINAAPEAAKRKRGFGATGPRPAARLFSEVDAKKSKKGFVSTTGVGPNKTTTFKGDQFHNGFLLKEFKISQLITTDVKPTIEEMQLFAQFTDDGTGALDLVAMQAAQKASGTGSSFVPGDNVEVYDGEQKGIRGTTVSVTGDIVTFKATEGALKGQNIDAPVKTLRKLFRDGDHVKVIGGSKYIDEVGMVTKIVRDKVTLLSDSTQQEITVFSRDLKRAADSATLGNDSDFELYDLVQLDAATVACVIKVDREILRVLDQNGAVRNVLHSQVSSKIEKRRHAVATDRDGAEIRLDDTIKEHGGESRQGRVLYIHRSFLFVQNREQPENAGIFVARSTNVTTMAAKSGRAQAAGPDLSKMNPSMSQPGANGGPMPPPRSMGRDKLIGKTVTIRKGPHKGLLGIVKDTNADEARVELHTKNKTFNIKKDLLSVKDPITGHSMDFGGKMPNRTRGGYGSGGATNYGGRTPGWGTSRGPSWGATPAGGRTPGWGGGGRTPGWGGNDGSRTAYGGNDGSRTSYGGATSYGGDGSRTAYGGNDGSRTSYGGFNSGGRTPAWGSAPSGSKTPAYNSHASSNGNSNNSNSYHGAPTPGAYQAPTPAPYQAPTPGGYNSYVGAPTPGAPLDAPTPGNFSAPTPGDSHPTPRGYGGYGGGYGATPAAAPTPGAWPETPWGAPETPAATGGGDEDPRYD